MILVSGVSALRTVEPGNRVGIESAPTPPLQKQESTVVTTVRLTKRCRTAILTLAQVTWFIMCSSQIDLAFFTSLIRSQPLDFLS